MLTFIMSVIYSGIRMGVPIVMATTGEIICEKSGVLNISLEGQMMAGAFCSFVASYYTNSVLMGLLAGMAGGMLMGVILAVSCVSFHADQSIAGIAINMLAAGMTTFWYRTIFGVSNNPPEVKTIPTLEIGWLSEHPVLGPLLFNHNLLVYVTIIIVIAVNIFLFKTSPGLKLRSVGEHPMAATTMGVSVVKVRYLAILACGALAGLGGSYLTLSILGRFVTDATAGRGFVALAITIFCGWSPIGGLMAGVLFGMMQGLQVRLQAIGVAIPYQFLMMLPYLVTLIFMIVIRRRNKAPAALAKPFVKSSSD